MSELTDRLDRRWYPDVSDRWDDLIFRNRILDVIGPQSQVLDLGAGAGVVEPMNFRGHVDRICGIDLDLRVLENRFLDDAKIANGEAIPYSDSSFDVVFSDNVLEHLENPLLVFKEITRVLKPGGHFLFKTPNLYHYMPTIARLTPHRFHEIVSRLRGMDAEDTFPTKYRANSAGKIAKLADESGFQVKRIELIESRPEYLRFNAFTYLFGFAYERIVNSTTFLKHLRILLIGHLVRSQDETV